MSHDAENWCELADFWAREMGRGNQPSRNYDHRVTDAPRKKVKSKNDK